MSSSSSSSSRKKEPKLSVRNQTCFKRSSFSSTKNTNLALREKTMLKKAYELSILCDNDVCIIHYDRNGQLVRTWPEDQSKVRDMAERFSSLSVQEKLKKNTNLSQCLNKRLFDDKKKSFENETKRTKYTQKILEFEGFLVNKLQIWQERVREILNPELQQQTGSSKNLLMSGGDVSTTHSMNQPRQNKLSELQNRNYYPEDLPSSSSSSSALIEAPWINFCPYVPVPHHQQQTGSFTNLLMSGGDVSTSTEQDLSRLVYNSAAATKQRQSKFSVFVLNHETAAFTQLPDSRSSSFDQTYNPKL